MSHPLRPRRTAHASGRIFGPSFWFTFMCDALPSFLHTKYICFLFEHQVRQPIEIHASACNKELTLKPQQQSKLHPNLHSNLLRRADLQGLCLPMQGQILTSLDGGKRRGVVKRSRGGAFESALVSHHCSKGQA